MPKCKTQNQHRRFTKPTRSLFELNIQQLVSTTGAFDAWLPQISCSAELRIQQKLDQQISRSADQRITARQQYFHNKNGWRIPMTGIATAERGAQVRGARILSPSSHPIAFSHLALIPSHSLTLLSPHSHPRFHKLVRINQLRKGDQAGRDRVLQQLPQLRIEGASNFKEWTKKVSPVLLYHPVLFFTVHLIT